MKRPNHILRNMQMTKKMFLPVCNWDKDFVDSMDNSVVSHHITPRHLRVVNIKSEKRKENVQENVSPNVKGHQQTCRLLTSGWLWAPLSSSSCLSRQGRDRGGGSRRSTWTCPGCVPARSSSPPPDPTKGRWPDQLSSSQRHRPWERKLSRLRLGKKGHFMQISFAHFLKKSWSNFSLIYTNRNNYVFFRWNGEIKAWHQPCERICSSRPSTFLISS